MGNYYSRSRTEVPETTLRSGTLVRRLDKLLNPMRPVYIEATENSMAVVAYF
jgi:hypothetical protein